MFEDESKKNKGEKKKDWNEDKNEGYIVRMFRQQYISYENEDRDNKRATITQEKRTDMWKCWVWKTDVDGKDKYWNTAGMGKGMWQGRLENGHWVICGTSIPIRRDITVVGNKNMKWYIQNNEIRNQKRYDMGRIRQ